MAIALNERNIPHEKCLVDLQNKPENFTSTYARASPARAKVPVLEVGDDVLVESMVILEYRHLGARRARARVRRGEIFGLVLQVDEAFLVRDIALVQRDRHTVGIGSCGRGPEAHRQRGAERQEGSR